MSAIHDALKKAQRSSADPSAPTAPFRRNLEVRLERKKEGPNWGPLFVVLVLLLITGPILAPVLSVPFRRLSTQISTREIALGRPVPMEAPVQIASLPADPGENVTSRGQFAIEEIPVAVMSAAPVLAGRPQIDLTGVMFTSPEEAYCILNGEVLQTGQSVQGVRVVEITSKRVTLEFQGETITLPVPGA